MNWKQVLDEISNGAYMKRPHWDCRIIRAADLSDQDFFATPIDLHGAIIEFCPMKRCDCSVGIWIPEPGDKEADDWEYVPVNLWEQLRIIGSK